MVDPASIITAIGTGLKLVDGFSTLVRRWRKKETKPFSASAEQVGDSIEIKDKTGFRAEIPLANLHMDEWDETRYDALDRRVKKNWKLFNELFAREAGASQQEAARITVDMESVREELCRDFKEMIRIYSRTLGISLPDHYQLYDTCF